MSISLGFGDSQIPVPGSVGTYSRTMHANGNWLTSAGDAMTGGSALAPDAAPEPEPGPVPSAQRTLPHGAWSEWFVGSLAVAGNVICFYAAYWISLQKQLTPVLRLAPLVESAVLALLCLVAGSSLVVAHRRLTRSQRALSAAQDSRTLSPQERDSWFGQSCSFLEEAASKARVRSSSEAGYLNETLPEPDDVLAPLRMSAEGEILSLRWLSSAAVLLGLLSTLFGLFEAVREAIATIAGSDTRSVDLPSVLRPIQFCFFGSGAGVAMSLPLGLLQRLHERRLDRHFASAEIFLRLNLRTRFFPGWQPPSLHFLKLSGKLVQLGDRMGDLVFRIDDQTSRILATMTREMNEQLKPLFAGVPEIIKTGMQEGASQVLAKISERFTHHEEKLQGALKQMQLTSAALQSSWDAITAASSRVLKISDAMLDKAVESQREVNEVSQSLQQSLRQAFSAISEHREPLFRVAAELDEISKALAEQNSALRGHGTQLKDSVSAVREIEKSFQSLCARLASYSGMLKQIAGQEQQNHEELMRSLGTITASLSAIGSRATP